MNPGRRDQFVMIERESVTPDEMGGRGRPTWTQLGGVWANVQPMRFGETVRQGALRTLDAHVFQIPTESVTAHGLNEKDRLVWDGLTFNIREVRHVSRRKPLTDVVGEAGVTQ